MYNNKRIKHISKFNKSAQWEGNQLEMLNKVTNV